MAGPLFPRTRPDGTFTVAARLRLNQTGATDLIRDQVAEWITQHDATGPVDLLAELSSLPRTEQITPTTVDIIFEGRSGSQLWKALLVDLTRQLTTDGPATLIGFWDLVAGQPHPASVEPRNAIDPRPHNDPPGLDY